MLRDHLVSRALGTVALCFLANAATSVTAKPPLIQISERTELRFGKFAVPQAGERTVATDGSISDTGLLSVGPTDTGPATFVITYDRGNQSKKRIDIELLLTVQSGTFSNGRITANLKNFTSDIPGSPNLVAGQPVSLTLPNCQTRICSTSFKIGATMAIINSSGGGQVTIPTYLDVLVDEVAR